MIIYSLYKIDIVSERAAKTVLGTGSPIDLRRYNRDAVLRVIKECGSVSRTEISDRVTLTNAAVSRITKELIDVGLVEEGERLVLKGQAGRRQVALRLAEQGAYVLGIAVTLNARDVVVGNGRGDIIDRIDCSDISLENPKTALRNFATRAETLIQRTGIDRKRLIGGAASVAGRVDPIDGKIMGADPLDWDGQKVAASFEKQIGIPFVSEGRAAALLQVERSQGPTSGLDDILLINVGLRLGAALMVDGNLLRGKTNDAFALNNFPLTPNRTLDDDASGFAILAKMRELGRSQPTNIDPGSFLRLLAESDLGEDNEATSAFAQCGKVLGRVLCTLLPILSPQLVILAGAVVRQPAYVDGVKSKLGTMPFELQTSHCTTAQSAVQLALDHHLFNSRLNIDQLMAA
ncbi:MAG: putative NBD/HSP70 family sugar kinase [Alphaproteobacteria bacterium]|jgi:predicted NBD/HSP70 family sugar kinase